MPQSASFYDGSSAHRHSVEIEPLSEGLRLSGEGWSFDVDAGLLQRIEGDRGSLRLGRSDLPGWRLVIPGPADPAILALVGRPDRYGRWIDRVGLAPALGLFAAVAAGVLAIGYLAPGWIAPYVPRSWEANLGDSIVGDFGENRCRNPQGEAALNALVERLEPGATAPGPEQIKVAALDVNIFNAAALPGQHIIVFKGAITETRDTDELAGVVAHEIAHVRRRHVTEALIRELGIGALIRLFAGDIGANAQSIVSLSYTRDHEREADADAILMLKRAGINPKPTGDLFARLAKEHAGGEFKAEFLNSHPLTADRAKRFAAAADPKAAYRPALTQAQSDALFNICWKGNRNLVVKRP
ncbi:MAG TPA: M48 family metallopeptidase [Sphingomicrobium sp.]|nr:M48 family metallopeptidase [Sphingomicrobium sp.]